MKLDKTKFLTRHWLTGLVLCAVGVLLARVSLFNLPIAYHRWVTSGGRLLAFVGIAVIAVGIHRRNELRKVGSAPANACSPHP